MKSQKIFLNIIICFISGMFIISCNSASNVYMGQHSLNEENIGRPVVKEKPAANRTNQTIQYTGEKEVLAVMDFEAKEVPRSTALSVSELIRTELINSGKYTVIERSQMKEILKEQGFQQSGCTEIACAVKIGKLLSARKMLVGSVIKLGTKLIISGRVIDVERGVGEKGAKGTANSVEELDAGVTEFINNL